MQKRCLLWKIGGRSIRLVVSKRQCQIAVLKAEMPVARPEFALFVATAIGAGIMQTGCVHSSAPPVWSYYDQCAAENPAFVAMAECGRQKRLAQCASNNSCSLEGTTFMEYVDSLALAVKNKKLTEAEALRRYAEYKSGGASTCTQFGNDVKC